MPIGPYSSLGQLLSRKSSLGKVTENDAFKAWFGQSKASSYGDPIVLFHGTTADFEEFDADRSIGTAWERFGYWFTEDEGYAADVASPDKEKVRVIKAYLSIQKPIILYGDRGWKRLADMYESVNGGSIYEASKEKNRAFRQHLISQGYDGVIILRYTGDIEDWDEPQNFYIALDPRQIKHVNNVGTFNPNDPNMFHGSPKRRK